MQISNQQVFLFLGCNTPWVTALAKSLSSNYSVIAVENTIIGKATRGPEIPELRRSGSQFEWKHWALPAGHAGCFSFVCSPLLSIRVKTIVRRIRRDHHVKPTIVVPYPYLLPWVRSLGCPLIYYNLDDYRLYNPKKAKRVDALEQELLDTADTTLCLSKTQVQRMTVRAKSPDSVYHFPLGVMDSFINDSDSQQIDFDTVVYVGGLEDRVDWEFVRQVVKDCPELKFYFVGRVSETQVSDRGWKQVRQEVFGLPNVTATGAVPQSEIKSWTWKAGINWMPYANTHPFNIASCPTKIMDYLAAGRPVMSTSIPECELYPEWITIGEDSKSAAVWLRDTAASCPFNNQGMISFAEKQTWEHRAKEFIEIIGRALLGGEGK